MNPSLATMLKELERVRELAPVYGWDLRRIDEEMPRFTLAMRSRPSEKSKDVDTEKVKPGDLYIWQVSCDGYRAVPPAFDTVDPLVGTLNTKQSFPAQTGDSFFNQYNGVPTICHPFNRRAYATLHKDWHHVDWERLASRPDYGTATKLHEMLLKIQVRLLLETYRGPLEARP